MCASSPAFVKSVTNKLLNSLVAGQNISGWNIVVEDIMMNDVRNGSLYRCVSLAPPITTGT